MTYRTFKNEHFYVCHDGRIRTIVKVKGLYQDYRGVWYRDFPGREPLWEIKEKRTSREMHKEIMVYMIKWNVNKYHLFL